MRRLILCAILPTLLLAAACAAPAAQQPQTAPAQAAEPTPVPVATAAPSAAPTAKKQYAIQGPDGKLQFVDADTFQISMDSPGDVCHAGEDIPISHCADCPQATEGYNTDVCTEFSCCCPFCPYAIVSSAYAGRQANAVSDAAAPEASPAKQENPAS